MGLRSAAHAAGTRGELATGMHLNNKVRMYVVPAELYAFGYALRRMCRIMNTDVATPELLVTGGQ
jgi:hypothetical protein